MNFSKVVSFILVKVKLNSWNRINLVHIINIILLDDDDILTRRSSFIGRVNNVFAISENLINMLNINCLIHTILVFSVASCGLFQMSL
jgi:hypothetical protein